VLGASTHRAWGWESVTVGRGDSDRDRTIEREGK